MKALAGLACALTLFGSQAAAASEAYIVPDAATPWVFQGIVSMGKGGLGLTCNATIEISGANDAADTSAPFSHSDVSGLSATIGFSGGFLGICAAYMVDPVPSGSVSYAGGVFTFQNVSLTTFPAGGCRGDLRFEWDENASPQTLSVLQELAPVTGEPCAFNGLIDLVSPATGDARAPGDPDHDPHQNI